MPVPCTDFDLTLWFLRIQIKEMFSSSWLAQKSERYERLKCLLLLKKRPNFFSWSMSKKM